MSCKRSFGLISSFISTHLNRLWWPSSLSRQQSENLTCQVFRFFMYLTFKSAWKFGFQLLCVLKPKLGKWKLKGCLASLYYMLPVSLVFHTEETESIGKGSFQTQVLTLIQNITENRLRHARGPVHYIESVTWPDRLNTLTWACKSWIINSNYKNYQNEQNNHKIHNNQYNNKSSKPVLTVVFFFKLKLYL